MHYGYSGSLHALGVNSDQKAFLLNYFLTELTFVPHNNTNKVVCRLQRLDIWMMEIIDESVTLIIHTLPSSAGR